MSYQRRIHRLARSWDAHLYAALRDLLAVYGDIPMITLAPFTPIPPSAN